jgi:2-polyprenyl-3-methyl-5-hydroxy-6-metoxy-1,4-benzoquinol methylase
MIEIDHCPVCAGRTLNHVASNTDFTVSREVFNINRCKNCGLGITTPRPQDNDLGKYYLSDNYISHSGKATSFIDKIYLIARRLTLRQKHRLLSVTSGGKRLLDYGCGTGDFLNHMKSNGWQVKGVEPAEKARLKANDLLDHAVEPSIELIEGVFDTITLWHVLEHVPNLQTTMEAVKSRLVANGHLIIAVPNLNSWESKYYGNFWAGYDTPRHLWHFSQKSMEILLANSKLTLIETRPMILDAFYVSLLSEKYKKEGRLNVNGMINAFFNGLKSNIKASKTGEYSSLIYVARNES